jgi:hypothetical protein
MQPRTFDAGKTITCSKNPFLLSATVTENADESAVSNLEPSPHHGVVPIAGSPWVGGGPDLFDMVARPSALASVDSESDVTAPLVYQPRSATASVSQTSPPPTLDESVENVSNVDANAAVVIIGEHVDDGWALSDPAWTHGTAETAVVLQLANTIFLCPCPKPQHPV